MGVSLGTILIQRNYFIIIYKLLLQVIPKDKTHNFDVMYGFLKDNWEIARWVALGVVVFEVGDETYPQLLILSKLKDARLSFIFFSIATRYLFL